MTAVTYYSNSPTLTYIGLSSDTKPSGVPAGSLFWESDTGNQYIFAGGSTWFENKSLTAAFPTQSANTGFMGPATGSPATPTFRALVATDLPTQLTAPLGIGTPAVTKQMLTISGPAISGGASTLNILPAAHTGVTTNIHEALWVQAHNVTISASTTPMSASFFDAATVLGSAATKTVTNFHNVFIAAPIAGANAVITNPWALGLGGSLQMATTAIIGWSTDLALQRLGAQSFQFGAAPSSAPLPYTITGGESSRGGTDTNTNGGSLIIQPGLGSGNASSTNVVIKTPTAAASGTTQQTYTTAVTFDTSQNATFAGNVYTTQLRGTTGIMYIIQQANAALNIATNDTVNTVLSAAGVLNLCSNVATPAGGGSTASLVFGTTAGFGIYYGSGAPSVSAAQGSFYLRSDGGSTTRAYINTNGSTGWTALVSVG